jgi:3-hydroxyisobutyrate dehydrogenase-like beta-hydroxyacid dehydrogenase
MRTTTTPQQHPQRIGILGLGIMGSIIAQALVQAGHEVVGYDPLPAARARLRRSGGGRWALALRWRSRLMC